MAKRSSIKRGGGGARFRTQEYNLDQDHFFCFEMDHCEDWY